MSTAAVHQVAFASRGSPGRSRLRGRCDADLRTAGRSSCHGAPARRRPCRRHRRPIRPGWEDDGSEPGANLLVRVNRRRDVGCRRVPRPQPGRGDIRSFLNAGTANLHHCHRDGSAPAARHRPGFSGHLARRSERGLWAPREPVQRSKLDCRHQQGEAGKEHQVAGAGVREAGTA